jgi:MoaA/NifB/PqqE/SkfB family radical SAM enzyme
MTQHRYASVDEEGKIVLPPEIVKAWQLSAGESLRLDPNGNSWTLHPPISSLRRIYIELTNQCNLNCRTCMRNVWEVKPGWLAWETYELILDQAARWQPLPELFFGGYGEPLSHPRCLEMVEQAKLKGFTVSLITNGVNLSAQVARRLVDIHLDRLWVSLDGASPECYQDVRLGNALPQIIENLKRLRAFQFQTFGFTPWLMTPKLGIAFVAMSRNIHSLPEVIRLGLQLGATEFSVSNVLAHDESLQGESLYLRSLDQMTGGVLGEARPLIHVPMMDIETKTASVMSQVLGSMHRLELMGATLGQNTSQCPFIERGSLSIRWDGKVSPCLPLLYTHTYYLGKRLRTSREHFVGDIHEATLREIWMGEAYYALRKRLLDFDFPPCTSCNSCEMADENQEDCYGNPPPTCGGCLWAQGLIRCP